MITGDLKSKIDAVWNDFWSGGISNPLEVMEQLTYLLFIKGLDEKQTLAENKANRTGNPIEDPVFPEGDFTPDDATIGRPYEHLRWDRFKNLSAADMYDLVDKYVFPFMQSRAANSTHAQHMKGARLTVPTPALLQKAVDGLDAIPMEDRDTKGDVYEYMLGKIATAGQNGQFRTPRHIIQLMVEMTGPGPDDLICDPACGTCGFLIAAGEYVRKRHPETLTNAAGSEHFHERMFHGYDFDNTMLRIGSMNMQLHGVQAPEIEYRDSLAESHSRDRGRYSLILANPPFTGSLDFESTAADLLAVARTKKTELLFLALFLELLKPGGRAAVVVPDGVLFDSTKAHRELRRSLVEDHFLEGVISLPTGVFKPYTGVSTAILLFTKTDSGGTDSVWFYDLRADGLSLDDRREPLLSNDKLGPTPDSELTTEDRAANNLPDALKKWRKREALKHVEVDRSRQSFFVNTEELRKNDFELSISAYRTVDETDAADEQPDLGVLLSRAEAEIKAIEGVASAALAAGADRTGRPVTRVQSARLGDISQIVGGGTPPRAHPEFFEGQICWATSKDMKHDYLDDTLEHITSEAVESSSTKLVPEGTILVVVKSKILVRKLPVAIARVPTCFGQDLKGIVLDEGWLPEYVAAVLRGGAGDLLRQARGANTEGLTLKHLRAFEIPAIGAEDQRAFATRLLALENLREQLTTAAAATNETIAGLNQQSYQGRLE